MKATCECGVSFDADWYRLEAIGPVCDRCYDLAREKQMTKQQQRQAEQDQQYQAERDQVADIGSISSGTMDERDLIPIFIFTLRELGHNDGGLDEIEERIEREGYYDSEDAIYDLNEYLWEALNEHSPPFCYFGSHPGDGVDYGFWPFEDLLLGYDTDDYYEDVLRVADLSEVPNDATGYVLLVNDHGNATLYEVEIPTIPKPGFRKASENLREIWSIV